MSASVLALADKSYQGNGLLNTSNSFGIDATKQKDSQLASNAKQANESDELKESKTWFFTTNIRRSFDYLKSIRFLEFTFLNSPAGESFYADECFYKELSYCLFNIDSLYSSWQEI